MQFITEVILVLFLTTWSACGTQTINVLFVNDIKNEVADKSMAQALRFFNHNTHLGIKIGTFINATVRNDNAQELSEILHTEYNNSIYLNKQIHIVLDNTLRKPTSEVVKTFTANVALPTVSTTPGQTGDIKSWNNLKKYELKYLIQISPPSDVIPEIVRSIVVTQNMTNAGIFFDDSFVMDHKYKSLLRNIAVRHTLIEINDLRSVKHHLTRLKETDIVNFFLLGHLSTIKSVLKIADSNHFYGKTYAWHAITQDDGELSSNTSNITVLFVKPYYNSEAVEYQDLSFNTINNNISSKLESSFYFDVVIHSILAIKSLHDSGEWVYNGSNESTFESSTGNQNRIVLNLRKHFKKVKETTSYGQFIVKSNGESFMEFNMSLEKVQIQNGQSTPVDLMGEWKAGLNTSIKITNFEGMANHSAVTVYKVVTALQEPFMMKEVDEFGNEKYSGYCVDLIEEIRKLVPVPFEYEMYTTPDNSFGFMSDSGNWNGMIKELIEKRADIALGSLTVLAERENVVDFTIAYYDLVGIAIMMKTFKSSTSLFKFLAVLETDVWLCILGIYFFTSFLIWIFDKWSPYSSQNTLLKCDEYDELPRRFNLIECLWFCTTSLTPQGGGEIPKNMSGKLVSATWWLFGVLLISSYTANLAAVLTVSRLDTPIESLDDLYKQYKIQYAPVNGSAAMTYFQRMAGIEGRFREIWKEMSLNSSLSDIERAKLAVWEYPISNKYTKIWKAMTEAGAPNSTEDATLRVLASKSSSDGFAYLGDATEIRYQAMINCDLQRVGDEFSRKPYAIALQKGSPLKDQFNTAILQLLNKRKLEQMKEQWWNLNPVNKLCKKPQEESDSISINNIGGVFIVIFVGMCLACISLVLEYFYKFQKTTPIQYVANKSKIHHHYRQKKRNTIFVRPNTEDQDTRY